MKRIPSPSARRLGVAVVLLVAVGGVARVAMSEQQPQTGSRQAAGSQQQSPTPSRAGRTLPNQILARPIADATPNAAQLRRGQYLVAMGDCLSCHQREGGEPLAGGLPLNTPFGVIYTPNITSDEKTGIGHWTDDQFYRAMHDGIDDDGHNLYPAFPYPWYRRTSRADDDAILAYLKTTPPVEYRRPRNQLTFPFNFRFLVKGWNLLFLGSDQPPTDPNRSAAWNQGAAIVTGLGHCSGCHTPKNLFGADRSSQAFHGGALDNWFAPDLTENDRTGLGGWSAADVAEYLKDGRNVHAAAGGSMEEVVNFSTSFLTDDDRNAIATYIKSLPASPNAAVATPDAGAMARGAAVYSDACTGCHLENGVGQPRFFPPLGHNALLQQSDVTGLEHIILAGSEVGVSPRRVTPFAMPSFAWKLSDAEIADVSTFLRNSWGNQAPPVTADEVRKVRDALHLQTTQLTEMSGDRP